MCILEADTPWVLVLVTENTLLACHCGGRLNDADSAILLASYARLTSMLGLIADHALSREAQLASLRALRSLGANAFEAAVMAGRNRDGLEMLEHTRAVMWSQALALDASTEMGGVPINMASELQELLASMKCGGEPLQHRTTMLSLALPSTSQPLHYHHQRASRIRIILREIRALPGLDRFMLGNSYSELAASATRYTVVVLITTDRACWAMVLRSPQQAPDLVTLNLRKEELAALVVSSDAARLRGASVELEDDNLGRGLRKTRPQPVIYAKLQRLWDVVVKPVLQHMQLRVRITMGLKK
jgi:hypothetical protein